jgi:hypothetical protein
MRLFFLTHSAAKKTIEEITRRLRHIARIPSSRDSPSLPATAEKSFLKTVEVFRNCMRNHDLNVEGPMKPEPGRKD